MDAIGIYSGHWKDSGGVCRYIIPKEPEHLAMFHVKSRKPTEDWTQATQT